MKFLKDILNNIFFLPIMLIIALLTLAFFVIISIKIERREDKKILKSLLKINKGQIYFLYADYNQYNFSKVISKKHKDVICIKIDTPNLLTKYLIKDCADKSYPRLVKIKNDKLIHKEHFNLFKTFYKKRNDIDTFLNLIDKSIKNLTKE